MSKLNINDNSSRTRSTLSITPQENHAKVALCHSCQMPMKRLPAEVGSGVFYSCSPCESVRHPFDPEDEFDVPVAVNARERSFLESLYLTLV